MTFLQPFILWGLPLILLPIVIHLLNRLRHRSQPWGAMRFLVAATRSSVNRARLKQFLILTFRTLAVLALILFLSRPLTGGWLGWAFGGAPDTILLLLDRSASMEATAVGTGESKRLQALRLFERALAPFEGRSQLVVIDSATRTPTEVGAGGLMGLPVTAASDTAADLPGLVQSAVNYLVDNRAGTAELWIASDLQGSNWQPDDARWKSLSAQLSSLPQKVRVRLLSLDGAAPDNVSVSLRELFQRRRGNERELRLVFDVARVEAGNAQTVPVNVALGSSSATIDVPVEGASARRRHAIPLGGARDGWGSIDIPADNNSRDNKAYFAFAPDQGANSLVVTADAASARFLQLASTPFSQSGKASVVNPSGFGTAPLEDHALIVWQAALPQGSAAARIEQFVNEGGVAVFFPPGDGATNQFLGFSWGAAETGTNTVPKWTQEEGPLANSDEGLMLPLSIATFTKWQQLQGPGATLASFADGSRFLVRQTLGRGEAFFVSSLPDPGWSSLWEGPVLVPALQRMLQSGTRRLQSARMLAAGETVGLDLTKRWESLDSPGQKDVRLHAGVYRAGTEMVAVNRPEREDAPEAIDSATASALFQPLAVQSLGQSVARNERMQSELWRLFLLGMLLFLLAEGFLILPDKRVAAPAGRPIPSPMAQPAGGPAR
ncbi:MAG TPA: BatA domain-containing protein [Methylomirabilota bacterium]|nr:BatA domain-containing protein [Methylomirabilota bacterium]